MERPKFSVTSPKLVVAFLIIIISTTLLIGLSERGRSLTQEEEILSGVFTLLCILLAIIGANLARRTNTMLNYKWIKTNDVNKSIAKRSILMSRFDLVQI